MTPRRFYLAKAAAACMAGDEALAMVWRAKQLEQPGVNLPLGFPSLVALAKAHYLAVEDLDGATADELVGAGLSVQQASAVLRALGRCP